MADDLKTLNVEVVAVDRLVWQGPAKSVVVKTLEGTMGILPGHEPVLAILADSAVRVEAPDSSETLFAVHGGFFSLDSNTVKILAETAEEATEIDVERAKAAKARAEQAGADDADEIAAIKRAETRLDVAMQASGGGLTH
ncbi:MAG: F0F1 ATP synthase subunit epsilon [Candidatus Nanopelagicales bacterium]